MSPGLALLLVERLGLPLALDALQIGRPLLQRRRLLLGNLLVERLAASTPLRDACAVDAYSGT